MILGQGWAKHEGWLKLLAVYVAILLLIAAKDCSREESREDWEEEGLVLLQELLVLRQRNPDDFQAHRDSTWKIRRQGKQFGRGTLLLERGELQSALGVVEVTHGIGWTHPGITGVELTPSQGEYIVQVFGALEGAWLRGEALSSHPLDCDFPYTLHSRNRAGSHWSISLPHEGALVPVASFFLGSLFWDRS